MRYPLLTLLLLSLSLPAHAAGPRAAPTPDGSFGDWRAATVEEAGKLVCYAFTNSTASTPAVPGRDDVIMTVTHRPSGRDAVALMADLAYPPAAEVQVQVEKAELPFYTSGQSVFARDEDAVVAAFKDGLEAVAKSPRKAGPPVTDTL